MKIYRSGSFWKNLEGAIGQYIYIPVYKSWEHKFEAICLKGVVAVESDPPRNYLIGRLVKYMMSKKNH